LLANRGEHALNCPVCKNPLSQFRFHHEEVDICRRGCGIWFDTGELTKVEESDTLENIDKAFDGVYEKKDLKQSLKKDPVRHCPRDNAELQRYEWNVGSAIVLDGCSECQGIWMDAGELEGYSQYIKNFRQHPPELTPELRAKMDQVKAKVEADWESTLDKTAHSLVPWDLWFIDDLRRHLIKMVGHTL
jgi:Zn-finger nucleic acid-binding protein